MVYGNYFTTENSIQGHLRKKKLEEKDGRLRLWLEASAAYPVAQNTEYQVMRIDSLHGVKPTTRYWKISIRRSQVDHPSVSSQSFYLYSTLRFDGNTRDYTNFLITLWPECRTLVQEDTPSGKYFIVAKNFTLLLGA